MNKLTFEQPKTKRTQEVGENETVKIATLKRLGWKQVQTNPQTGEQQPAPQGDTDQSELAKTPDGERIMPEKLPTEGQPPAKNVKRTDKKDE